MSEDGYSNMFVILDDSFDNCTVSHLNIFINDLRKILNISSDVHLKLCRIDHGSVILIFQLPTAIQKDVLPLSDQKEKALADLHAVELSCGGTYHFNRRKNMVGSIISCKNMVGSIISCNTADSMHVQFSP